MAAHDPQEEGRQLMAAAARKVPGLMQREAAKALRDAAELRLPLSPDEAVVLRLAAEGVEQNPDVYRILGDSSARNPRTDLYDARTRARDYRKAVAHDPSLLSEEDHALLRRASRANDVTLEQIRAVGARLRAEEDRRSDEFARQNPDAGSRALEVDRDVWPRLVELRRYVAAKTLPEACFDLAFYVADAAATDDWMGYGSREAYLRTGLQTDPALVEFATAALRLFPAFRRAPVPQPFYGAGIDRGQDSHTPACEMLRDEWPTLARWRRITGSILTGATRGLISYVDDAETTGDWIGFDTRKAYLRDRLGIDPALVDLARGAVHHHANDP